MKAVITIEDNSDGTITYSIRCDPVTEIGTPASDVAQKVVDLINDLMD